MAWLPFVSSPTLESTGHRPPASAGTWEGGKAQLGALELGKCLLQACPAPAPGGPRLGRPPAGPPAPGGLRCAWPRAAVAVVVGPADPSTPARAACPQCPKAVPGALLCGQGLWRAGQLGGHPVSAETVIGTQSHCQRVDMAAFQGALRQKGTGCWSAQRPWRAGPTGLS